MTIIQQHGLGEGGIKTLLRHDFGNMYMLINQLLLFSTLRYDRQMKMACLFIMIC